MRRMLVALAAAMAIALPASAQSAGDLLKQKLADAGVGEAWFGVGDFVVMRDSSLEKAANDIKHGVITTREYDDVLCMVRLGFLQITKNEDILAEAKAGQPMAFSQVSLNRVRRITTRLTPSGVEMNAKYQASPALQRIRGSLQVPLLGIQTTVPSVGSVIDDRTVKKDVNEYRVIKGTIEFSATPEGERMITTCQQERLTTRNAILLFKKDSFSGKWTFVTWDLGTPGQAISDNVATTLARSN